MVPQTTNFVNFQTTDLAVCPLGSLGKGREYDSPQLGSGSRFRVGVSADKIKPSCDA